MRQIAPRITVDEKVRFGAAVIQGTRVPVSLVVGQLGAGMTVEQLMDEYRLEKDDVLACLSYAACILDNVDAARHDPSIRPSGDSRKLRRHPGEK